MTDNQQPEIIEFDDSGLPDHDEVRRAYELVKHIPRAVGSAQILAQTVPHPSMLAGHMLAFVNDPRIPLDDIRRDYSDFAAEIVEDVRTIYDEKKRIIGSGISGAAEASFVAVLAWDTDQLVAEWQDKPLDTPLMKTEMKAEKAVITQMSLEQHLRSFRRQLEDEILPILPWMNMDKLEERFKQSLRTLELKIADAPAPAAQPQPQNKRKPQPRP